MSGIALVGSSPTFCKIPVTTQSIIIARFPATPTVMYTHLPAVPRPARLCTIYSIGRVAYGRSYVQGTVL